MEQGNSWQKVLEHRRNMYDAINSISVKLNTYMVTNSITEITLKESIGSDDYIMIKRTDPINIDIFTNDGRYHILSFMQMILSYDIANKYADLFTEFVNKLQFGK